MFKFKPNYYVSFSYYENIANSNAKQILLISLETLVNMTVLVLLCFIENNILQMQKMN